MPEFSVVGFFIYTQLHKKTGVPKRSCFVVSVVIMNYLPALIAACAAARRAIGTLNGEQDT